MATLTLALVVLVAFQGATQARAAPGDFTVTPTTLTFPDTYAGSSSSLPVTIKNVSSTTQTPNFAGGAPNDPTNFGGSQNCAGVALAPNDTCEFTYTFEPASAGPKSSSTTIGIDSENFQITMSGTGLFPFTVTPTTLTFPDTYAGSSSSLPVTIKNVSPSTLTPNFAGGAPNDPTNFGGSQNCAGVALAPNDTCEFTYTFEPASAGPKSSSTTIGIDSENFQITMSGTGLFPFTVTPTTLTFPDTNVGSVSSLPVTIKNVSPTTLTPNYAGGAPNDPTNFGGSQNCAGVALAPNDTCEFTYTFEPASAGPKSSSTTIGIDSENFEITMSGTGVSPTAVRMLSLSAVRTSRGVSVRWRTASSVDTLGFNVYRERRGQRVRLNHNLIPAASGVAGRRYSFLDRRPVRASRYWIQAVSTDGSRSWYGAVSAVRPG